MFVKLVASNNDERMRVYRTNGVFRIVSMRGEAIPIPDEQIEALRTVVTQQVPWTEHPFLKIGQRVRIRGGSLEGVEGVLLSRNGDRTLIISVDAIQRSLAVRVEGYDVEAAVNPAAHCADPRCKKTPPVDRKSMESSTNSAGEQGTALPSICPGAAAKASGWQLETAGSGWEALERVHAGPGPDLVLLDLLEATPMACTLCAGCAGSGPIFRFWCWPTPTIPIRNSKRFAWAHRISWFVRCGRSSSKPRSGVRSFYSASTESEIVSEEIEQIGDDMFFVAASPTMRKLRAQAELLAQVSAPVLILGENGSGKELAARLIHKLSVRSGFRFLKLNCATLPGDVLESELFGASNGNGRSQARQTRTLPAGHAVSG